MIKEVTRCAPSENHVLIVQTCARPENYLQKTLESAQAAGLEKWRGPKIVIADGYDPRSELKDLLRDWIVLPSTQRKGFSLTFGRALLTVREESAHTHMTFFEDDVAFAQGSLEYIAKTQQESEAFLTAWWTGYPAPSAEVKPYWHMRLMRDYASSVCISIPAATLDVVLDDDRFHAAAANGGLENVFRRCWPEKTCALHYPGVVQHVGLVSAVGPQPERVSPTFVGQDFDVRVWL